MNQHAGDINEIELFYHYIVIEVQTYLSVLGLAIKMLKS